MGEAARGGGGSIGTSPAVIIPVHNEVSALPRALDGVLRQDYGDRLHIVVVANGCTDGTAEAARTHGDAVRSRVPVFASVFCLGRLADARRRSVGTSGWERAETSRVRQPAPGEVRVPRRMETAEEILRIAHDQRFRVCPTVDTNGITVL